MKTTEHIENVLDAIEVFKKQTGLKEGLVAISTHDIDIFKGWEISNFEIFPIDRVVKNKFYIYPTEYKKIFEEQL